MSALFITLEGVDGAGIQSYKIPNFIIEPKNFEKYYIANCHRAENGQI